MNIRLFLKLAMTRIVNFVGKNYARREFEIFHFAKYNKIRLLPEFLSTQQITSVAKQKNHPQEFAINKTQIAKNL